MEKLSAPETKQISSQEEELAHLRELYLTKEREIAAMKAEKPSEETLIKETISAYKETPGPKLHEDYALKKEEQKAIVLDLRPETHDGKIAELLGVLQTHGLRNALNIIAKLKDPHLDDDFERFLVQYVKSGFDLGLSVESPVFKALHMSLFEVTLPEKTEEGTQRPLRELVSSMEQLYAGMMSVDEKSKRGGTGYFAIELAVANHSDEFTFYVAVHDSKKSLFEKQMLSIFHDAKIVEKKDDYNIFNESGSTMASYATYAKNSVFPLKTYEEFDHDPLNVLLNSFSKIKTDGEGAAVQIIFKPQGMSHTDRYKKILDDVMKGTKVNEAITKHEGGAFYMIDSALKAVFGFSKSKEAKQKEKEEKKEQSQQLDQLAVDNIKKKIAAPTVALNIRLIASAEDSTKAEMILGDLEASFNQFDNTSGNRLVWKRASGGKLLELLHNFSYRLFDDTKKLLMNLHELTSVLHLPASVMKSAPHLKVAKAGTAPVPSGMAQNGVLIGVNRDRGGETKVFMAPDDRLRHFYVIGQTGTGKTTLLKNMIVQDIQNGEGVCMIDPHGSDIDDVLAAVPKSRYEDVIYFDPAYTARPMALNMLEYDPNFPEQKTFVVNELFSIFQKLYGAVPESMGPMFEQYFRNATLLVIDDPETGNTLLDVSRVLADKKYRELKLSRCKNPIIVQFWREVADKAGGEAALSNIVPYITSKFDVFLANDIMRPIIAQEKSSFNFREIMDGKKILLVNLSKGRLGDINANLIGLILVGKILMAALSRVDSLGKNLPPFYLYIDEFQNVTTNSIATILSEARKYKLALNIAHQFIAQLEEKIRDAVFGNVGSLATFRVGADDAEYLEKQFSPTFSAKDIMSIDNRNAYVKLLSNGSPVKPFNIETMPPPAADKAIIGKLKELSYLKYGGDRQAIESKVLERFRK